MFTFDQIKTYSFFLISFLVLMSSVLTYAEDKWFQVDMVIFEHRSVLSDSEQWPEINRPDFPDDLIRLQLSDDPDVQSVRKIKPKRAMASSTDYQPYYLLDTKDQLLTDIALKLEANSRYHVLFAGAWHQPILSHPQADTIYIYGGEVTGQYRQLEGTVKLIVKKYLHGEFNFYLSEFNDKDADQVFSIFFNPERQDLPQSIVKQRFNINESRRMKSNKLHYIDHPKFGILIQLTSHPHKS